MTAEATLRATVLKRIHEDYPRSRREVLVFGRPAGAATGPGHPDLFGVACGHFLALEIKVANSKPTPMQIQHIQDLRFCGAYAWVVRSPLDATRAVYQAKTGGRMPSATDPIDFDDWFKEITSTPVSVPVASVADKAEPSTEADSAAIEDILELGEQAAVQPEPSPEALAEMPEVPAEKQKRARRGKFAAAATPTVDDLQEARDAGLLNADQPEPAIVVGVMDPASSQSILVELIKAVGDRVTEVWEQGQRLEAKLDRVATDLDALLEDLNAAE